MKKIRLLIIYIFIIATNQAQSQQDIILSAIEVEGNTNTNTEIIVFTSGLKVGSVINAGDFSRAVKQLWQSNLFNDVQIYGSDNYQDSIAVTIKVEEAPILTSIQINGNKKVSKSKIDEKLNLRIGQRISDQLLETGRLNILSLYKEEGYLLADVVSSLKMLNNDSITFKVKNQENMRKLVIDIDEGRKVKIDDIYFIGNKNLTSWKLRRALKETKKQRWYLFWRSSFDENKYADDKEKLRAFYQKHGYRDAMITSDSIAYSSDNKKMEIWLNVIEGPKYYYRDFNWEGNDLYTDNQLSQALGLNKGEAFNAEQMQKGIYERAQALYMDRGYIYSNIVPEITPVGKDSLDINFTVIENHKVYVRNINISGNTRTRENVIRRALRIYPGDVFSREKLIRSQREVWILNYFGNVIPDVLPVDENNVDLEISVEEKSSERANLNVGYSEEFGLTGGGGLQFMNFRGKGQSFNISASTGLSGRSSSYYNYNAGERSKYHSFSLSFTDPMVNDTPNLIGGSLFYSFQGASTQYYYPLDIKVVGGALNWGRRFRWPDDFFRGRWGIQITQKNYDGSQNNLDLYTGGLTQSVGVNITQVISRDSRDRPEYTTSGSRVMWSTTLSGGLLGGNEDFHKHVLNMEFYTPLISKFVLVNMGKIGAIGSLASKDDEISIIPYDERFIMGGNGIPYGNMLRGYDDNAIGPISSSGSAIGGNTMFKFTSELRFSLSENPTIYLLAFAEAGNVWANQNMTEAFYLTRESSFSLKRAAGVGVRFFMPMVGMLGFDLGYGFDDINGDGQPEGWKTTITFGQ
jgi:outer membrane protein insertion porin family